MKETSYTEEERQQIYRLFGEIAMPDRWNKYQDLVKILGLDHRPNDEIRDYIILFLRDILAAEHLETI